MELARVLITEFSGEQYIFLREVGGERTFPIVIGINEALAIDRRLKGIETERPMTHELLANVIEALGATIDRIHIHDLRQSTFIATIYLVRDGEEIEIDSRPSDAIALGVAFETPVYVGESVLRNVLDDSPEHRRRLLTEHHKALGAGILELQERLDDEQFTARAPEEMIDKLRDRLDQMKAEYDAIQRVLDMLG